jgi:hypothetical protein
LSRRSLSTSRSKRFEWHGPSGSDRELASNPGMAARATNRRRSGERGSRSGSSWERCSDLRFCRASSIPRTPMLLGIQPTPTGPYAPRDGGESDRIHFGADKAVAIALQEVKKREGWSGNPDWVTAEWSEALTWHVVIRRWSRTSVGRRIVVVSARTGNVLNYEDPND